MTEPAKPMIKFDPAKILPIVISAIIAILGTLVVTPHDGERVVTETTTVVVPASPTATGKPTAAPKLVAVPDKISTPAVVGSHLWIPLDGNGNRIDSPPLESVAASLADGRYAVTGVPNTGEPFITKLVTITTLTGPRPPPTEPDDPPIVVEPAPGPVVDPSPTKKITAVTYVYEKDDTAVPSGVHAALNRINRERKPIIATQFEQNTFDGDDEIPDQYKVALERAQREGLPALIVLAGSTVVNVVKAPKTELEVWEAVP